MAENSNHLHSNDEELSLVLVKQEPQEPSSFCYDIIVKEELIIEDEFKPLEEIDNVQVKTEEPEEDGSSQRNVLESTGESGNWHCAKCNIAFKTSTDYYSHNRRHKVAETGIYSCQRCEKGFTTKNELGLHHQQGCNGKKVPCLEATLKEENGTFKCTECGETFTERKLGLRHLVRNIPVQDEDAPNSFWPSRFYARLKCNLCPMTFAYKKHLKNHLEEHKSQPDKASTIESESGENPTTDDGAFEHRCTVCKKAFREKYLLNNHIRRHEAIREGKFTCNFCDVRCGGKQELMRHEELHQMKLETNAVQKEVLPPIIVERANHTVYKCPECAALFDKRKLYFTHAKTHENLRNRAFTCDICGMCFPTNRNVNKHRQRCLEGKPIIRRENFPFDCPKCGKKFALRKHLIPHLQCHEALEKGLYQCKICAKYCGSKTVLRRHQNVHTVPTRFKCPECGTVCASSKFLIAHQKRHEAIRSGQFKCTACEKNLGSKYHLDVHTRKYCPKKMESD